MLSDPQQFGRLRNGVLFVAALAWVWLLTSSIFFGSEAAAESHSCHGVSAGALGGNAGASWASGWFVMTVAMMAPTLIAPLWYIRMRSFSRRRWRASALFVFAYTAVWMIVGGLFFAAYAGVRISQSLSFWLPASLAIIALIWQMSPAKQRCLNACHAHPSFSAFGTAADLDALRFGISHAVWCVGSCWALMLFPMLLPRGQVVAMAAVSILIFAERLENPARPRWRFRGFGKASRILAAQTAPYVQKLGSQFPG